MTRPESVPRSSDTNLDDGAEFYGDSPGSYVSRIGRAARSGPCLGDV